jgi:N-dimethylarginine dimethylaminohydrolase
MKTILMCRPTHFDVTYDINPWMSDQIGQVDKSLAMSQWQSLHDSVSKVAHVEVMDGVEKLPDLVFTANAGYVRPNINMFIVSKFSKPERSLEEFYFSEWFMHRNYRVFRVERHYEGEGDHLVDGIGRHWLGSGFRTDAGVASELQLLLGDAINVLELVDPRWYHLDTAFCPLPGGELLWYPGAFSLDSQAVIRRAFKVRVEVGIEDALCFSCNALVIGLDVFLPTNGRVSEHLMSLGYRAHEHSLGEFLRAGGAAKCLTLHC